MRIPDLKTKYFFYESGLGCSFFERNRRKVLLRRSVIDRGVIFSEGTVENDLALGLMVIFIVIFIFEVNVIVLVGDD